MKKLFLIALFCGFVVSTTIGCSGETTKTTTTTTTVTTGAAKTPPAKP